MPNRAVGSFPAYLYKSLDELEGPWGEPSYPSNLIIDCHALHKKPLLILSDRELDLALEQAIGLPWLRTLVLQRLRQDPLRAGQYGEVGELLRTALTLSPANWGELSSELHEIANALVPTLPETPDHIRLIAAFQKFAATR